MVTCSSLGSRSEREPYRVDTDRSEKDNLSPREPELLSEMERSLQAAAEARAESINAATREKFEAAEADDEADPAEVFDDEVVGNRAAKVAVSAVAFATAFGKVEAAGQSGRRVQKRWVVTSSNPRASHAALDGETVDLDEDFSNGMAWPGATADASGVANCECELEIVWDD